MPCLFLSLQGIGGGRFLACRGKIRLECREPRLQDLQVLSGLITRRERALCLGKGVLEFSLESGDIRLTDNGVQEPFFRGGFGPKTIKQVSAKAGYKAKNSTTDYRSPITE